MSDFSPLTEALMKGNPATLLQLVNEALDSGRPAGDILNSDLLAGMDEIGRKMASGEMFIPEVLMAARAMNQAANPINRVLKNLSMILRVSSQPHQNRVTATRLTCMMALTARRP